MAGKKALVRNLAFGAALGAAAAARASLTIEVQLPSGGKSATVSTPGQQVQLDVFAVVTGANASGADDGMQIAQGSFRSTGTLYGNLAGGVVAPFNGVGSTGGASVDLDGDGDNDVGSNNDASAAGFWGARSSSPQSPNGYPANAPPIPASSYGTVAGSSYRVKLGTLLFTVSSTQAQATAINFTPRNSSGAALWYEETLSPSKTPSNGTFAAHPIPVTITLAPEWAVNADGLWSGTGNWSAAIPSGVGVGAQFLGAIQQDRVVTVDSPRTLGSITFDNTYRYTLDGVGGIKMDVASGAASVRVVNGSHMIATPLVLFDSTVFNVVQASDRLTVTGDLTAASGITLAKQGPGALQVNNIRTAALAIADGAVEVAVNGTDAGVSFLQSLTIAPAARLDLNDNDIVIDNAAFGDIQALVLQGFGASTGITSSTSDGTQFLALFDNALIGATEWGGQTISATAIVGKYTYFGDLNFDGQVTGDDYGVVDGNLDTTPAPGIAWLSGDANLDGVVTGDDYGTIDSFLGLGAGNPLAPAAVVPEPGVGLLSLGALMVLSRRRRKALMASEFREK